jgi:hypothetical protein
LIHLNQVVKTYHTPAGPFTALKNVSLQVKAGEFAAGAEVGGLIPFSRYDLTQAAKRGIAFLDHLGFGPQTSESVR